MDNREPNYSRIFNHEKKIHIATLLKPIQPVVKPLNLVNFCCLTATLIQLWCVDHSVRPITIALALENMLDEDRKQIH